jgi:hypothetical protein
MPGLRRPLAAALGVLALCTCESIDNVEFAASGRATIAQATLLETLLADALDFSGFDDISFDQQFENQGVSKDQVDSVRLLSFVLTIDGPEDQTFDFLDAMEVTASSDGLPDIRVASISGVPMGARTLSLDVEPSAELQPYVVAPSMTLSVAVEGRRPESDTDLTAEVLLDVDIHVPGCN